MGSALAVLSRDLSRFLLIPAGMALLSLVVCVVSGEWFAIAPFLITLSSVAGLSGLLNYFGRSATERFSQRQTLISVAVGWALVCAVGALPIWLTAMFVGAEATPTVAYFTNALNALFEGFSGFTSAGLTMVIRPSQLPVSLQWWRSFMQWVGGVGVIVLTVALLEPAQDQYVLYQAEGRQQRLRLTMTRTVRRIWAIYAGYTAVAILLFRLAGMTWWEAVNHSMSAISTGGFSITDGNMSSYGTAVKVVVMLVMLCGAISFSVHDQLITKFRLTILLRDRQHFLLLGLLIVGAGVVGLEHYTFTGRFAWTDSIFQWVSALTT
ncbi:MAG: potassium transporter TrkG, partial [Cyanobacteria bacterium J06614_10]